MPLLHIDVDDVIMFVYRYIHFVVTSAKMPQPTERGKEGVKMTDVKVVVAVTSVSKLKEHYKSLMTS